jgi:hypothetical protein
MESFWTLDAGQCGKVARAESTSSARVAHGLTDALLEHSGHAGYARSLAFGIDVETLRTIFTFCGVFVVA